MDITLPLATTVYNIHDRLLLVDLNAGRSCRGGNIYIPTAAEVAANAGVSVDIGAANAALTDITQPELGPMVEGDNYNIPQDIKNSYSLKNRWIQASVNDAVVRISPYYA
jgi:hypothetical protein